MRHKLRATNCDCAQPAVWPSARQHAGTFAGKRILCIHSGGSSKRVPQNSTCGKLFSTVPRLLPECRRSALFDEFMIGMSTVASCISEGMLACLGDVLLFNALQINFYGADGGGFLQGGA